MQLEKWRDISTAPVADDTVCILTEFGEELGWHDRDWMEPGEYATDEYCDPNYLCEGCTKLRCRLRKPTHWHPT